MGLLVEGKWRTDWYENDEQGHFRRPATKFHDRIGTDAHPGRPGRYHLYVSYACPWAQRVIIARAVKGIELAVGMSVVDPVMGDDGWQFAEGAGATSDQVHNAKLLRELYVRANPGYTGRVTVPVLWDVETDSIVCNESREIVRMLDQDMDPAGARALSLHPERLRERIEKTCDELYDPINNGVYSAGFATSQTAYEEAVWPVFEALDRWDRVLAKQRYLCGDVVTAADVFLFTTLYRFDAVYHGHFKCNVRRIVDYKNLWPYARDLYSVPEIQGSCNIEHVKRHYYRSHPQLNPSRIVPVGPVADWDEPQDRDRLGGMAGFGER